jgi:hypothetical protein
MKKPTFPTTVEGNVTGTRPSLGHRSVVLPGVLVVAAVVAVMLLYFVDPNPRLDFSAFDTRDAESYLALSQSLVADRGYTRSLDPQFYIPHTTWPPGLPILLAPFVALSGVPVNLLIVKLGMIAYGAAGILLAYLYARRLSRSPLVQLAVPFLLALDPYYWQLSRMTDTEAPTVLWALVALLLADIGWARGEIRYRTAFAIGLVAGFGMTIRASLAGALFLPLVYLVTLRAERAKWRHDGPRYLAYAAGFILPFATWVTRNSFIDTHGLGQDGINQFAMFFRTLPADPGSPLRTLSQTLADVRTTLATCAIYQIPRALVPGFWSGGAWAWLGAAAAPFAAGVSLAAIILSFLSRRNWPLIALYGSVAAINVFYAAGAMPRLWVPVTCLVAISLPFGAEKLAHNWSGRAVGSAAAALAAALSASLAVYIVRHDRFPYHDRAYAALANLFETIRSHDQVAGNVLTPDPQAFGLYTGLKAPMPVPGIGIDPQYNYVILPSTEWNEKRLPGTVLEKNGVWSFIALSAPLRFDEFRQRYDCTHAAVPTMSVVSNCLIY